MMTDSPLEWFTLEYIDDTTIAISEYGHWENAHSYLLCGDGEAMLIDTGLGIDSIRSVVRTLTEDPVLVLTTHVHWDHIGGHQSFNRIAVHEAECSWLEDGIPGITNADVIENLVRDLSKPLPETFDPESYEMYTGTPSQSLSDGDLIRIGNRTLKAIHTPGHSPGHVCFHEPDRGYLFTGDLLYEGTVFADYPSTDPVTLRNSLRKVNELDNVETLLPSHHRIPLDANLRSHAKSALDSLAESGHLEHGSGEHCFAELTFKF